MFRNWLKRKAATHQDALFRPPEESTVRRDSIDDLIDNSSSTPTKRLIIGTATGALAFSSLTSNPAMFGGNQASKFEVTHVFGTSTDQYVGTITATQTTDEGESD